MTERPKIVQKYGGTSLGTAERILSVVEVIKKYAGDHSVIVAVSALSPEVKSEGTTSLLLESARQAIEGGDSLTPLETIRENHRDTLFLIGGEELDTEEAKLYIEKTLDGLEHFLEAIRIVQEISPRTHDAIVSVGELLSARLLTTALQVGGVPSSFVDLSQTCPEGYKEPDLDFWKETTSRIQAAIEPRLLEEEVPVITGFMGPVPGGIIEAVGRGYTDHTAALAAAAVGAKELQIWKEVDGVFTANPAKVPNARVLETLTPEEASELTYFGSEVIHPMTMERSIDAGIPLRVKNTFKPDLEGTLIMEGADATETLSPVRCVTAKDGVTILHVQSNRMFHSHGFMAKLFDIMEEHEVVVDLVSTSEVSVSMTVDEGEPLEEVVKDLKKLGDVNVTKGKSIVSVVGAGMKGTVGLAASVFGCLGKAGINIEMISQGASKMNLSCVVDGEMTDLAVTSLHKEFLET